MVKYEPDEIPNLALITSVITSFVAKQESVTVFDVDKSEKLFGRKSALYRTIHSSIPILIYDGLDETRASAINDMGGELEVPSITKSYFVISSSAKILEANLKHFATINTNGRWFFGLIGVEKSEVENVLRTCWTKHRMTNIVGMSLNPDKKINVQSYNPFNVVNNQGTFSSEELNIDSLPKILNSIENFLDQKVKMLKNYKFIATRFIDKSDHSLILDAEFMEVFQKILNVQFTIEPPSDGLFFGKRLRNGSFTGLSAKIY